MAGFAACTVRPTTPGATAAADVYAPAAAETGAKALALERAWSLIALEGTPVNVSTEAARPSLVFDGSAKRVSGMAGVNRFGGTYTLEGQTLKFGALVATKMAGPPELNELETRYLRALGRTNAWRIDGAELKLHNGSVVLARFSARQ